jgi:hypothetical protein
MIRPGGDSVAGGINPTDSGRDFDLWQDPATSRVLQRNSGNEYILAVRVPAVRAPGTSPDRAHPLPVDARPYTRPITTLITSFFFPE